MRPTVQQVKSLEMVLDVRGIRKSPAEDPLKDDVGCGCPSRGPRAQKRGSSPQRKRTPRQNPSPTAEENVAIEHFLEAAVAWAEDSNFGLNQGLAASNPWHRFAAFLYAGKIYE